MMDFPGHDSGAGIAGLQGPLGQLAKRGQITVAVLEPEPPDCDEKQAAEWRETTKLLAEDRQKTIAHLTKLTDAYDTLTGDLREFFR